MSSTSPVRHARRALIWLCVLTVGLLGILIAGVSSGQAQTTPKLALDLEGGTQMILAPRVDGNESINDEQLQQAVEIIRQRVDGSGVSEAEISTQSGRNVVVSLPGTPDAQTRELIQASANMEFRPVIMAGSYGATPEAERLADEELPEPSGEPENASDTNWITPELYREFEAFDCEAALQERSIEAADPEQPTITCDPEMMVKYIVGPVEVDGDRIADANYGPARNSQGFQTGGWAVQLSFDSTGASEFREVTSRLVTLQGAQNQFAIMLDGLVVSAPTANAVIPDGNAEITGNFTEESAQQLAEQLKYGALPISFDIQSEQQISATLGANQLQMGLIAGVIGLVLVAVYSLFQYRTLGLVTLASLVVAGILTYLALVLLGWSANYRLSLAGIAGIVVAIGLTADSFIVYFERIRDELRDGRNLVSAVETGWLRARRTIIASKAVNLLASVVLYVMAVGNVRGFAFTLGLTAIADLIVVFLFTHPVLQLLARTKFFASGHKLSGLDPSLLGVQPLYQGAGRVRGLGSAAARGSDGSSSRAAGDAGGRLTIAERRRAAAAESAKEDDHA
ncbi:protein translocase subunit SecD [Zhihengliuella flava]|uniref:Protein translocase subunit SecD n=1 Tax=Zhihengliuella flava TaxID=1285193 RepID=A0A931D306_9MICC|nr:protein translocase subunit SecD [Zhihengliuella flava]MBG6083459.1 preprotein translocase subunit SecD [Zhihengliuella flava]